MKIFSKFQDAMTSYGQIATILLFKVAGHEKLMKCIIEILKACEGYFISPLLHVVDDTITNNLIFV